VSDGDLHGRPTAVELLDAVAAFLKDQLPAHVDEAVRHQVRIAARAVEIAAREARLGPAQAATHLSRLRSLGFETDGELARALREGSVRDSPELRQALIDDTRDRLLVANPGWLPDS
jgi:hypothetical protein